MKNTIKSKLQVFLEKEIAECDQVIAYMMRRKDDLKWDIITSNLKPPVLMHTNKVQTHVS